MNKSRNSIVIKKQTALVMLVTLELLVTGILTAVILNKNLLEYLPLANKRMSYKNPQEVVKRHISVLSEVQAQNTFTYDHSKFAAEGFPEPSNNLPELDPEGFQLYQQHVMPHIVKAANAVGTDVGFLAAWSFMEGINYNMAFNSCRVYVSLNTRCSHSNWQVSHGIRPMENLSSLQEAFDVMYGNHDPETIQKVGQSVIDTIQERHGETITNPASTFPRLTIDELVNVSDNNADSTNKMWTGHIMRDDAIYSYLQAVTMKYHWDRTDKNLATLMEDDWGSPDHYNRQRVIDFVKATYDAGISGSGVSSGGGVGSGSQTFTLVLRPLEPDSWVINRVTANAIGGGNGGSGGGQGAPPGSVDGHCTPTGGYPTNPEFELSSKYNVTASGYGPEGVKMIYELMTCLSGSRFVSLFADTSVTIHNGLTIIGGNETIGMGCSSNSSCDIYIPEGTNAFKFILTHEFGHVIHIVNSHETIHFSEHENAYDVEGGLSPYSGGGDGCEAGGVYEDYAEMVAYYYNPTMGGKTGGCDNRVDPPNSLFGTSDFPLHLEVAKKVL